MIQNFDRQMTRLAVFAGALIMANEAGASVSFSSYANLSVAVNSIVESGTGNAVDYSDLHILGAVVREADVNSAWTNINGGGYVNDARQEIPYMEGSIAVGNYFTHAFNLDGTLNDGEMDFNETAYYDVSFVNDSAAHSFDVTLSLSYDLSSQVDGQDGSVSAMMSFFDDTGTTLWADTVTAVPGLGGASGMSNVPYTFTIGAGGDIKSFYIDVNHNGILQAAPVPLPAAVWPFMTGLLAMVGMRKRKRA